MHFQSACFPLPVLFHRHHLRLALLSRRHHVNPSPSHWRRRTDFLDILMFDPTDGALSLRRCTVSLRSVEQTLSVPSSVPAIGGTSISLSSCTSLGCVSITSPAGPAPAISLRSRSSGHCVPRSLAQYDLSCSTYSGQQSRGVPSPFCSGTVLCR
jgi:hypothetical protein